MKINALKALAEAAKLALGLQSSGCTFLFVSGWGEHRECDAAKTLCAFSSAANPAAILELIAENERLTVLLDDYKQGAQAEADGGDAARAEVRVLRAELRSIWEKDKIPCRPFLFSFTEDRLGCTVDFDGEPYHYTELDRFLETATERDQLRAEAEALKADADRAGYWKQRAKSAEGHLYAGDCRAASKALHQYTKMASTPWNELTEAERSRLGTAAYSVIQAVNGQRNARRPKDITTVDVWCECGDGPSDGFVCPNCLVADGWTSGAEVEALKADACRYQWLRDGCGIVEYRALTRSANAGGMLPSGDTLDEVIDAAMKGGTHG